MCQSLNLFTETTNSEAFLYADLDSQSQNDLVILIRNVYLLPDLLDLTGVLL